MVAKPVSVGIVGVIVLASALVLNYFVLPDEETEIAAPQVAPSTPPAPSSKSTGIAPKTPAASAGARSTTTTPAPPPKQELPSTPSFDIVRIDPEGNAVIAGRGAPNSEIAIIDGEDEIGRVVTDDRGEWVFVPPAKLAPGERVLMLRGLDKAGKESTEAVVLVIPERGKDIAGRPSAEPSVPLAVVVPRDTGSSSGDTVARVLQAPSAGPIDKAKAVAATSRVETDGSAAAGAAAPKAATSEAAASGNDKAMASASSTTAGAGGAEPSAKVPGVAAGVPAVTEPTATPSGPVASTQPEIARATASQTAGSTPPASGGATETTKLATAGAAVSAFPEPAPSEQKTAGEKSGDVAVDVIDYDDKGEVVFSGRSEPGARVEVFIDDRKVGDTAANADGRWKMQPTDPVPPGSYQLRVDKVAPTGTVVARVAFPFVRADPLTELPKGRLVVIQPGNNLWRIATRVYGSGVRYVEIFDANQDQILNPDLIFPGQVFGLPRVN